MGIGEEITVTTARPETISADVAIAIYPNHPKYGKYLGKKAVNPFTQTEIPIIQDERVSKDFGTGALKVTPGHDLLDYEIGKTHNLPILHAVSKGGRITNTDPRFEGLKILEAREKAAQFLSENGGLEKVEDYTHSVPVCERCKTVVEPLISEEWFVKMKPLSEKALKNLSKINFTPKNYKKIIADWMDNIHDWSISRSLWWGHRIPVWYCQKCNPNHEVGKDKDMAIALSEPGKNCQTCHEKHWVQDEQVLDTWFSSGMWPLATLGWPQKSPELNRYYPWNFEISAPEIKYLWIARMIMLGLYFQDEIPFKNMFFHGMLRDLQGRKFSKSLGNGIDPNEMRLQWGTDAVRMVLYSYSAPGRDGRASRQTMDERSKNFRNFATKLRNITRFVTDLKPKNAQSWVEKSEITFEHPDDEEIKKQLDRNIESITNSIEKFELHIASELIYNFVWHHFADIYIEKSKNRRAEAQPVLEYILRNILILLHPFMPFLTEELYRQFKLGEKMLIIESWPESK